MTRQRIPGYGLGVLQRCGAKAAILATGTVLAVAGLTGCSLPGPKSSEPRAIYLLQASSDRSLQQGGANACLTVQIATPRSAPGYATSRMAYTNDAPRLDYFAYHRWADTPAKMLVSAAETQLDDSGLFAGVLPGSSTFQPHLRLETELKQLRQEFDGQQSRVVLQIKSTLLDVRERQLLGSRVFRYVEAAAAADPRSGVVAANRATDRWVRDLDEFLREAVDNLACPEQL